MFLLVMMVLLVVVAGWLDTRLNWHDVGRDDAAFNIQADRRPEVKGSWV